MTDRNASSVHSPNVFFEKAGQWTSPGIGLKYGCHSHWAKNRPPARQPSGPCPNCGEMGHWKIYCPSWPCQGRSVPLFREVSWVFLVLVAKDWCCPGTSAPNEAIEMKSRRPIQTAGKFSSFFTGTEAIWSIRPTQMYPCQISEMVLAVDPSFTRQFSWP